MPDFGCYVTVVNNCTDVLTLTSKSVTDGNWKTPPPDQIEAGTQASFILADSLGSEGFATYQLKNTSASVNLHFSCPVWSSNVFTATSTNSQVLAVKQDGPNTGHPLIVTAYCSNAKFKLEGTYEGLDIAEVESHPVVQEWNSTEKPSVELIKKYEEYLTELKSKMQ